MGRAKDSGYRYLINCAAAALLFLLVSGCASQDTVKPDPEMPWSEDMKKYPTLLTELKKMSEAIRQNVQSPPVRHQSALLALLPASTAYYAALPNSGEAAHQALMSFPPQSMQSPDPS